jgi:hypothetical protein
MLLFSRWAQDSIQGKCSVVVAAAVVVVCGGVVRGVPKQQRVSTRVWFEIRCKKRRNKRQRVDRNSNRTKETCKWK